jgi:DNA-binding NarL/FixJ family response regulator
LSGVEAAQEAPRLVAVADRTPVFLHGLATIVADGGWDVASGATAAEVRDLLGKAPDLLVIDLRLLSAESQLCASARERGVGVVVIVPQGSVDEAMAIVDEGVAGLWERDGDIMELRRIINGALDGNTVMSADVGGAVLERIAAASSALRGVGARLTAREREILRLMADGAGNRAIADTLFISENTVRNHVRSVLDKLHAQSRTEAVVRAVKAGLVRLG